MLPVLRRRLSIMPWADEAATAAAIATFRCGMSGEGRGDGLGDGNGDGLGVHQLELVADNALAAAAVAAAALCRSAGGRTSTIAAISRSTCTRCSMSCTGRMNKAPKRTSDGSESVRSITLPTMPAEMHPHATHTVSHEARVIVGSEARRSLSSMLPIENDHMTLRKQTV